MLEQTQLLSSSCESPLIQCLGQLNLSLALLTTDLDAVFDYIQQTVTAVSARRRHTVLIYVNEIYSPFTSAWQTYSSLKTSSSFQ